MRRSTSLSVFDTRVRMPWTLDGGRGHLWLHRCASVRVENTCLSFLWTLIVIMIMVLLFLVEFRHVLLQFFNLLF